MSGPGPGGGNILAILGPQYSGQNNSEFGMFSPHFVGQWVVLYDTQWGVGDSNHGNFAYLFFERGHSEWL